MHITVFVNKLINNRFHSTCIQINKKMKHWNIAWNIAWTWITQSVILRFLGEKKSYMPPPSRLFWKTFFIFNFRFSVSPKQRNNSLILPSPLRVWCRLRIACPTGSGIRFLDFSLGFHNLCKFGTNRTLVWWKHFPLSSVINSRLIELKLSLYHHNLF